VTTRVNPLGAVYSRFPANIRVPLPANRRSNFSCAIGSETDSFLWSRPRKRPTAVSFVAVIVRPSLGAVGSVRSAAQAGRTYRPLAQDKTSKLEQPSAASSPPLGWILRRPAY
jgi:hypothetical protein